MPGCFYFVIMHEMALAQGMLDIVLSYAEKNEVNKVTEISVLVGEMTGVVADSLEFCFTSLARGTKAEGAVIKIKSIPLRATCGDCQRTSAIENYNFTCPHCGSVRMRVISGRELRVESLEAD